jgi:biopolymer transport protein ExbB
LKKIGRIVAVLSMIIAALPAFAAGGSWWNADWKYRKEISFDLSPTGAAIAGSVSNAPVLIRLSLANFGYFNDTKPDGSDFRVIAADDKTPLKFHFERYDVQNQMAFLWVDFPQLAGGSKSDKIYLYYGNPSAVAAGDAAGSFDAEQALVLEFSETSGPPLDQTANKNNPRSSNAEPVAASLIGGGVKFTGAQTIAVPSSASLRLLPNQGLTATAWVKIETAQAQAIVFALADKGQELTLGIAGTKAFARFAGSGAPTTVTQSADLSTGQWHHLALVAGAGQLSLYVDGAVAGQAPVSLIEIGGDVGIGGSPAGASYLTGELDEVTVARTARGADWIKAAARSQGPDATLVVYGADGQKEGGQTSYFGTIAKNLTIDGWFVIGICMAMLFIALVIMTLKTFEVGRAERANRRFLNDYHNLPGDALAIHHGADAGGKGTPDSASASLSETDDYSASTLQALYLMGMAELKKRQMGRAAGAALAGLSPQSVEAIRASMDATQTRLQQRLAARMVLLTIAISGGPFLGLLGTVIGVMITFAAIAASGDVNVNAIAPGTAAALAATVAGLSVAIPCLFGYNWLNTRIKAISADNRVFLDEFVARIAEKYCL